MTPLTTNELIEVWEKGLMLSPIKRSLHLVCASSGLQSLNQAADLSIGQRDTRLLQLREYQFGSRLSNTTNCPECSEQLEWFNDLKELQLQPLSRDNNSPHYTLRLEDFEIVYRLPTTRDLITLTEINNADPESTLLNSCILEAKRNGAYIDPLQLPAEITSAINNKMSDEDPQANITMLLTCAGCGHEWESVFDIGRYLWAEINSWAIGLLGDVYFLAKTFGWSENHILSMSQQRRQLYLEMIRA